MHRYFAMLIELALMVGLADAKVAIAQVDAGSSQGARAPLSARINWRDYPEVSPFQGVRWRDSTPEVLVHGRWYELTSIDDLPAQRIIEQCRSLDSKDWQKRFEEDLVAVLRQMDWKSKNDAVLTLRRLDSGETESLQHVALTKENRVSILRFRQTHGSQVAPGSPKTNGGVPESIDQQLRWQGFARRSPFEAVRWTVEVPEVRIQDTWYELLSLNNVPRPQIIQQCKQLDDDDWQKRFEEDLVEVLARMGHPWAETVDLELRDLQTKQIRTLPNVAMTEANRDALRRARSEREQSEKTAVLTRKEAEEDIDALRHALESEYAYLARRPVDWGALLTQIRAGLTDHNRQETLKIELAQTLTSFGDGHSGIADLDDALPRIYMPFLIDEAGESLVAFREDRTGFIVNDYPFVKRIDGMPIEQWLEAARPMVAAGSPQFVRHASVRFLRFAGFLRQQLHLPSAAVVRVELASFDGSRTTTAEMLLTTKKPLYGEWPRTANHLIAAQNIGYLRLGSMADDAMFLSSLRKAMSEFRDTRGLVIDVRGNGGGLRDGLRTLFPYFMRPDDPPHVVNVAAYRFAPTDKPGNKDGYLSDRYLYPVTASIWSPGQRTALEQFAPGFRPVWTPPAGAFSEWHYSLVSPSKESSVFYYSHPVVVLMDVNCFSATDIFLGAFKGWRDVTLIGGASGGGSGRPREIKLPHGSIHVKLSTMVSFQPNGRLYDGDGIEPDVNASAVPTDFIGHTDSMLELAIKRLGK